MDLNDAPRTGGRSVFYDKDAITHWLRRYAYKWVPELFPSGHRQDEGGEQGWRVADISGRRPDRNGGSCRIWLTGPDAGSWYDFQGAQSGSASDRYKGGPTSTLKERLGIEKAELYEFAAALIVKHGGKVQDLLEPPKTNGHTNGHANGHASNRKDHSGLITTYLNNCYLIQNTIAHTYWNARGLGELPWSAYQSADGPGFADLLFSPNATNYDINRGTPALIHKLRLPNGEWTRAIHIEHLRADGSWHIGPDYPDNKRIAKRTWGSIVDGGVCMLAPIGPDGALAIGEGIETTAAGMRLGGLPGWATCGTAGMVKFGEALLEHRDLRAAIKRLCVLCDVGKGGEATARRLCGLAVAAGVERVELYIPRSGDDMAADVAAGYTDLPPPITEHEPVSLPLLLPPADNAGTGDAAGDTAGTSDGRLALDELHRQLLAVERGIMGNELNELVRAIAFSDLSPLERETAISLLSRRSGIKRRTIEETIRSLQPPVLPTIEIPPEGAPRNRPWVSKISLDKSGDPKGIMANAAIVIREADELKGCVGFNDFEGVLWVTRNSLGNTAQATHAIGHGQITTNWRLWNGYSTLPVSMRQKVRFLTRCSVWHRKARFIRCENTCATCGPHGMEYIARKAPPSVISVQMIRSITARYSSVGC